MTWVKWPRFPGLYSLICKMEMMIYHIDHHDKEMRSRFSTHSRPAWVGGGALLFRLFWVYPRESQPNDKGDTGEGGGGKILSASCQPHWGDQAERPKGAPPSPRLGVPEDPWDSQRMQTLQPERACYKRLQEDGQRRWEGTRGGHRIVNKGSAHE